MTKINWKDSPAGIRKQILDMFHVTEEDIAALDEEGGYGKAHREARRQQALIREDIVNQIQEQTIKPLSIGFGPNHYRTPKPLTRRQKFRRWRRNLRWSIHDRLFPECHDYD